MCFSATLRDLSRVDVAAMWANGAVRPNEGFERFAGFVFVVEDRVLKVGNGHGELLCEPTYVPFAPLSSI